MIANFNESDVRQFYRWLDHHLDEYTEIRALSWPPEFRSQFWVQNEEDFVSICKRWSGKRQVYAGINPRKERGGKTEHVARIIGIPFDVDCERPSHTAATDKELDTAKDRCTELASLLKIRGYNEPYVDMSGNGFRVVLKVDIPITNDVSGKLEAFFHEIDENVSFSMDSVFDLPRIVKVPGTLSLKGEPSEERPHRLSYIISLGNDKPDEELANYIQELKPYTPPITPLPPPASTTIKTKNNRRTSGLRPCFKRFAEKGGKLSQVPSEDHLLRLALVIEAQANHHTRDQIISLYEKADDYNIKTTTQQVDHELKKIVVEGLKPWKCDTIIKHHGCYFGKSCHHYPVKPMEEDRYFRYNKYGKVVEFFPTFLVDDIIASYKLLTFKDTKKTWIYENGYYKDTAISTIKKYMKNLLGVNFRKSYSEECIYQMKIDTSTVREDVEPPPHLLNIENGILNIETRKLQLHNSDYFFTATMPVTFNPKAKSPNFQALLDFIDLAQPTLKTLQEFCGSFLLASPKYKKAGFIYGPPNSLKTTFTNAIAETLGRKNICSIPLQNLDRRFQQQRLYKKKANICGDLGAEAFSRISLFKRTVGGDTLEAEVKGANKTLSFIWNGKHLFDANELPEVKKNADTEAFYVRLLMFPFSKQLPQDKIIPGFIEQLTTPEEKSGILNWMLEGLTRLQKQGRFTEQTSTDAIREHYKRGSDTVYCFVQDHCKIEKDVFVSKAISNRAYVSYCVKNGFTHKGRSKFYEELGNNLPAIKTDRRKIGKGSPQVWLHLKIIGLEELVSIKESGKQKKLVDPEATKVTEVTTVPTYPTPATDPSTPLPLAKTSKNNSIKEEKRKIKDNSGAGGGHVESVVTSVTSVGLSDREEDILGFAERILINRKGGVGKFLFEKDLRKKFGVQEVSQNIFDLMERDPGKRFIVEKMTVGLNLKKLRKESRRK